MTGTNLRRGFASSLLAIVALAVSTVGASSARDNPNPMPTPEVVDHCCCTVVSVPIIVGYADNDGQVIVMIDFDYSNSNSSPPATVDAVIASEVANFTDVGAGFTNFVTAKNVASTTFDDQYYIVIANYSANSIGSEEIADDYVVRNSRPVTVTGTMLAESGMGARAPSNLFTGAVKATATYMDAKITSGTRRAERLVDHFRTEGRIEPAGSDDVAEGSWISPNKNVAKAQLLT